MFPAQVAKPYTCYRHFCNGTHFVEPQVIPPIHRHQIAKPSVGDFVGNDIRNELPEKRGEHEKSRHGYFCVIDECFSSTSSAVSRKMLHPQFSIAPAPKSGTATKSYFA
jgi:hypothetical protein